MQARLDFPGLQYEEILLYGTGILPSQEIRKYIRNGLITAAKGISESQIQPASIDLRLGSIAYELHASFLPAGNFVTKKIASLDLCKQKLDLTKPTILCPGNVYLVQLQEEA